MQRGIGASHPSLESIRATTSVYRMRRSDPYTSRPGTNWNGPPKAKTHTANAPGRDDHLRDRRWPPGRRRLFQSPPRCEDQADAEGNPEDRLPGDVARTRDEAGDGDPGAHDVRGDVLDHLVEIGVDLDRRDGRGARGSPSLRPD